MLTRGLFAAALVDEFQALHQLVGRDIQRPDKAVHAGDRHAKQHDGRGDQQPFAPPFAAAPRPPVSM